MCPLQSLWLKVHPLSGNLCNLTWNSICRSSSTLAPSSGDDAVVSRTTFVLPSWTMDQFRRAAMRAVSIVRMASSSCILGSNVILRMQDSAAAATAAVGAPRSKPLLRTTAICEADQRFPNSAASKQRRRVTTSKRLSAATANSGISTNGASAVAVDLTPLQQSQQLLQAQDYILHQIPPPPTPLVRRLSKEWVSDYKHEARIDKINYNNIFGGASDASNNEIPNLSPPPLLTTRTPSPPSPTQLLSSHHLNSCPSPSPASVVSMEALDMDGHTISPKYLTQKSTLSSSSSSSTTTADISSPSIDSHRPPSPILSSSLTTTTPTIIASLSSSSSFHHFALEAVTNPSPHDVICGRGGKANTHPGNISFRNEAKKLRDWYDSSSKSEKFTISSYLVDIVREQGGRFLTRDKDVPGRWHEAESGDVRKKASQALREGRAG